MYKQIADMNVRCSLQVRNFNERGVAMSDCCGGYAPYAVCMDDGSKMYRCWDHRFIQNFNFGPFITEVYIDDEGIVT